MNAAFLGDFKDRASVITQFSAPPDALRKAKVYAAWYGGGSYDGSAFVLYARDGKLYEVNGSHCSCNGLEGQWSPEETTWEALALGLRKGSRFDGTYYDEADKLRLRMTRLISRQVPAEAAK